MFQVGQGVVGTTPPLGIEMAGFHRAPGSERLITGIRQPTACRALVLGSGDVRAAVISVDICAISRVLAKRVRERVAKRFGIPAGHVHVHATHTHSMPTTRFFRQWGAVPPKYVAALEDSMVRAVGLGVNDLAPADVHVGKANTVGGNFNRTTKTWKTDKEFTDTSDDSQRWLDTTLHVVHFLRAKPKRSLLWYHYSAHPVCYTDGNAGPDWPGLVAERVRANEESSPAYLQGHCGDVNPGDGDPWIGEADQVAEAVYAALQHAVDHARKIPVDTIRVAAKQMSIPLDLELFKDQLARYRKDPSKCTKGEWVDARFAKDWAASAAKWDMTRAMLPTPISAMRLGSLGLFFHPAELYSCYGLQIRRDSPFEHTLVVGYTDAFIGYLPDPNAYKANEYAAIVVPKITDLPPFTPTAARALAAAANAALKAVAA